jgi:hypothetical protein
VFHKEIEAEIRILNIRPQRRLNLAAPGTLKLPHYRDPGLIQFERLLLVHEPGEVFGKWARPRNVAPLGPFEFRGPKRELSISEETTKADRPDDLDSTTECRGRLGLGFASATFEVVDLVLTGLGFTS